MSPPRLFTRSTRRGADVVSKRLSNPLAPIVEQALDEAVSLGSSTVEAEHLLLALAVRDAKSASALWGVGLDHATIIRILDAQTAASLRVVGVTAFVSATARPLAVKRGRLRLGASTKRALQMAAMLAHEERSRSTTGRHLLMALLRPAHGTVPRALALAGVDAELLRTAIAPGRAP